uniref:Uncharacterized protein n=1 Tax=Pyricularia oryzae (strain P131) TaxID=1143193 RepID=L7JAG9_PYRO1
MPFTKADRQDRLERASPSRPRPSPACSRPHTEGIPDVYACKKNQRPGARPNGSGGTRARKGMHNALCQDYAKGEDGEMAPVRLDRNVSKTPRSCSAARSILREEVGGSTTRPVYNAAPMARQLAPTHR